MKATNIGRTDTAIRATLGTVVIVLAAFAADAHPFLALGEGLVGSVILLTAMVGVCPLYSLLGFDAPPSEARRPRFAITPKAAHLR